MTGSDPMPAWASKIGEKLDKLFPEEADEPAWVTTLLERLDGLTGDGKKDADEPEWVAGLMAKLDSLGGGSDAKSNSKTPAAPKRRPSPAAPPASDKPRSRWFGA